MNPATETTPAAAAATPTSAAAAATPPAPAPAAAAASPATGKAAAGKLAPKASAAGKAAPKPAPKRAATKPPATVVAPKAPAVPPPAGVKPVPKKHAKEAVRPVAAAKPKGKLVRDSFTMPQSDFDLIVLLKDRALGFKRPTKKSELLRAGLQVLAGLGTDQLKATLERLAPLKTGRPSKGS